MILHEIVTRAARNRSAIAAPGRPPLAYAQLSRQIAHTGEQLARFGIRRNDKIAIVLANGPEMATAFLGVACAATAAPLNPAYREDEFRFYLDDLKARAVLVEAGSDSPVTDVARQRGIA